jgi:DMSO/TMAO reductase YedYZ molybdopterin-dependent catalytic subunit
MTPRRIPAAGAALAGAVAGGAGIAAAELLAGIEVGAPSPVVTVGDLVIALQPPGAKEFVVGIFGTNDKLAVNLLVIAVALAIAAALGLAARRHPEAAVAGFVTVGAFVALAALREPLIAWPWAVLGSVLAVGVSVRVLTWLLGMAGEPVPANEAAPAGEPPGGSERAPASEPAAYPLRRRQFLVASGGLALASVAAGILGRRLLDSGPGSALTAGPGDVAGGAGAAPPGGSAGLPAPASSAPPIPAGAAFDVPDLTPLVVPADQFYRIDTALVFPRIDIASWRLAVTGMVDREVSLSFDDLVRLPNFEQYVTIACVSNEVGGSLVGNALWRGVHLRDVLAMAGVKAGATQIVGRSVDDFTVGFPTAWAMDPARDPMIAIGMNGGSLPAAHGYPARLIVPGLYGYVSATKWLKEIELTTLEAFDAYWVPLGWAKEAPILTQARIDVPHSGARVPKGTITVAGVAWAPDRGISRVEVRIGGGDWQPATVSVPLSDATWVQWRYDWAATVTGIFDVTVRATDGTGAVQEERVTRPAPDGARGYHRVSVEVA